MPKKLCSITGARGILMDAKNTRKQTDPRRGVVQIDLFHFFQKWNKMLNGCSKILKTSPNPKRLESEKRRISAEKRELTLQKPKNSVRIGLNSENGDFAPNRTRGFRTFRQKREPKAILSRKRNNPIAESGSG